LQAARLKFPDKKFIVEDTSLVFDAWNGLPGPLVKWYLHSVGCSGMWQMVQAFPNKKAQAICTIGYSDGDRIEFFQGITEGTIVEPTIASDFGRDALFQPDGCDKTFAHMTKEEKNIVSHRGKALALLQEFLVA
jgi:inosine triphosphate pyrophosphatase